MTPPTISSLLSSSGLSLESVEFAAHLDGLPLNERTGLLAKETRAMYEIPTRQTMGAQGND